MTARATLSFPPRLLRASEAAAYLGVSATTLRALPIQRKMLGTIPVFDRFDLDAFASSLPVEGEDDSGANSCDSIFGATG